MDIDFKITEPEYGEEVIMGETTVDNHTGITREIWIRLFRGIPVDYIYNIVNHEAIHVTLDMHVGIDASIAYDNINNVIGEPDTINLLDDDEY